MKKFAGLMIVLLLVAAVPALAGQEKEMNKAHKCTKTALDAETKVKLEKIKLQYKLDMVDLKAEKTKLHDAMMEELMKEESSKKELDKLGKSMNALQAKMHKAKVAHLLEVKKVVPADYWKAYLSSHAKHDGCSCSCCSSGKCSCGGKGCTHASKGKGCCSTGKASCRTTAKAGCASAKTGCETSCKIKVKK